MQSPCFWCEWLRRLQFRATAATFPEENKHRRTDKAGLRNFRRKP